MTDAARPAVFLDRDGTISEEMGYMNHLTRFHVFPFSAAAIKRLNDAEKFWETLYSIIERKRGGKAQ